MEFLYEAWDCPEQAPHSEGKGHWLEPDWDCKSGHNFKTGRSKVMHPGTCRDIAGLLSILYRTGLSLCGSMLCSSVKGQQAWPVFKSSYIRMSGQQVVDQLVCRTGNVHRTSPTNSPAVGNTRMPTYTFLKTAQPSIPSIEFYHAVMCWSTDFRWLLFVKRKRMVFAYW